MKRRNKTKHLYRVPVATPVEVAFEYALLADSTRMLLYIDELENINAEAGDDIDSDMFFEF